jgi:hypothetical protein
VATITDFGKGAASHRDFALATISVVSVVFGMFFAAECDSQRSSFDVQVAVGSGAVAALCILATPSKASLLLAGLTVIALFAACAAFLRFVVVPNNFGPKSRRLRLP